MAKKGRSNKPVTKEWSKHLRKVNKREAHKRERKAGKINV